MGRSRVFNGKTLVKIPIDEIANEVVYLTQRNLQELSELAFEKIMENTLRFGTRPEGKGKGKEIVSKKLRSRIREGVGRFGGGTTYVAGAFAPHSHLLEDGHIMYLWGRETGKFVKGYHFVYDAETDVIERAKELIEETYGKLSITVRR